jgi:hypothetical protein
MITGGDRRAPRDGRPTGQLGNRYDRAVSTTTPAGSEGPLLFPVGHYVGIQHRIDAASAPRQVRRGATFHDLTEEQFAVWAAAHGSEAAIENDIPWQRQSVEQHPLVAGLDRASEIIDDFLAGGLLVEVTPSDDQAIVFARSHRVVPLMLGLGNRRDEPDMFGIGFLNQPVIEVSHPIYDLWQWSAMDDSLWATCENAADVARRAGSTDPESLDPARLLTGFLGSLHGVLLANAACLDIGFRLEWPHRPATERATAGDNG